MGCWSGRARPSTEIDNLEVTALVSHGRAALALSAAAGAPVRRLVAQGIPGRPGAVARRRPNPDLARALHVRPGISAWHSSGLPASEVLDPVPLADLQQACRDVIPELLPGLEDDDILQFTPDASPDLVHARDRPHRVEGRRGRLGARMSTRRGRGGPPYGPGGRLSRRGRRRVGFGPRIARARADWMRSWTASVTTENLAVRGWVRRSA